MPRSMEKEAVGPLPFLPAQTVHHDHPLMASMLEYVVVALAANAQTKLTSRMENAGIILTKQTPRDLGLPPANRPLRPIARGSRYTKVPSTLVQQKTADRGNFLWGGIRQVLGFWSAIHCPLCLGKA